MLSDSHPADPEPTVDPEPVGGTTRAAPLHRRDLLVVAGLAAGLRLVWVVVAHRTPQGLRDPFLYQRFAESIASGKGYTSLYGRPTAYYPPGYPYVLGALQWSADLVGLGGHLPLVAGLVQALLGGVAAAATAVAGARLAGRRVGLVAGLLVACWPNLVLYSSTLLSETLYLAVFSLLFATLVGLRGEEGPPWRAVAAAGLLLGATTLVRPQVLLVVPALGLAWLAAGWRRGAARAVLGLVAGTVVVLAPWTIRNLVVMDGFVPVSTNGGDNLCVGFHEGAPGHFAIPASCDTGEFYVDGPAAELRRDAETSRRARTWALDHLGELPALSARKLFHTYRSDTDGLRAVESYEADRFLPGAVRSALRLTANTWWALVGIASAAGVVVVWRERSPRRWGTPAWAVLAVTAASALVPVLFFGDGRFKVPATPCFAVLAAATVVTVADRWAGGRRGRQPRAAVSS